MKMIYAVSRGQYSGHRILALFEDKTDAEEHAAKREAFSAWRDDVRVEEFPFFPSGEQARLVDSETDWHLARWDYEEEEWDFFSQFDAEDDPVKAKIIQDQLAFDKAVREGLA